MSLNKSRYQFSLNGIVQGIGLRPFLHQLAIAYQLTGFCRNRSGDVLLVWQGKSDALEGAITKLFDFLHQFGVSERHFYQKKMLSCVPNEEAFHIRSSKQSSETNINLISPDRAICEHCIQEITDPNNPRFEFALNNCATCGPRYSIVDNLPFDRHATSMAPFALCASCLQEYRDIKNRRYHAQTISCPTCAPKLSVINKNQECIAQPQDVIPACVALLKQGAIMAIKGIGGYHLCALANHSDALKRLRLIKHRPDKPFALIVQNIYQAQNLCHLNHQEITALQSAPAPIVICQRKNPLIGALVCEQTAPMQQSLGLMLPYTALYYLLLKQLSSPLVVTSANFKDEPIIFQDSDMLSALPDLADYCLMHERAIVHPVDDSVVQLVAGHVRTIRLSRGYIPFSCEYFDDCESADNNETLIGVGGHLKNHVAVSHRNRISLSPYFGDLSSYKTLSRRQKYLSTLVAQHRKATIIQDYHPDYASRYHKSTDSNPLKTVLHHIAHIFAVVAEYRLTLPITGFAWDGFGLGENHSLWGCETFSIQPDHINHTASLAPIRLLGIEKAFLAPKRILLSMCLALRETNQIPELPESVQALFSGAEITQMQKMYDKKICSVDCSSMGRLFDGIAVLLGGPNDMTYEAQAALYLETLATQHKSVQPIDSSYKICMKQKQGKWVIDWHPLLIDLLTDLSAGQRFSYCAYQFHLWCAKVISQLAHAMKTPCIVLSGGVFQNKLLSELCHSQLLAKSLQVYQSSVIPTNDSGLAIGQIAALKYLSTRKVQRNTNKKEHVLRDPS